MNADRTNGESVSLITGAASGLGRAMAIALLANGDCVAAMDLPANRDALGNLVAEAATLSASDRIFPVFGDVRSETDCEDAVQRTLDAFGTLHALVNNAGLGMSFIRDGALKPGPAFYEVRVDAWRRLVDTNLNGPFLMARAATPFFVKQKWGRIINIGTGYEGMLRDHFSPYGPVKAALEAATLVWSKDLAGSGVTVNVLMPGGAADTPQLSYNVFPDRSVLLPPSVMGAPIVWLVSRKSDGVTGHRFVAMHWDPAADDSQNLERAGAPAGWESLI
jgi:NAD(P)-dependent dehydrogenase (short-subunit alcohol dehydrogenase family)